MLLDAGAQALRVGVDEVPLWRAGDVQVIGRLAQALELLDVPVVGAPSTGQQAVAEAGGAGDGPLGEAADPHRRSRLLHRARSDFDVAVAEVVTGEVDVAD